MHVKGQIDKIAIYPGGIQITGELMKVPDIALILAGAYLISGAGCVPGTPAGPDAADASGIDSSGTFDSDGTDAAFADAGGDAAEDGIIDAEIPISKGLCEICTEDSECVDGTVCVSIEVSYLKECHIACGTDEDCNGSECVVNNGRGHCDPDEPCYQPCAADKPFFEIKTITCIKCLEDGHCYNEDQYCSGDGTCTCVGKKCDKGTRQCDDCQCGACCDGPDCESTEVCWEHSCVAPDVPCDNECGPMGMMCYTGGGAPYCIDCLNDSDCPEDCTCSGDPLWACTNSDGSSCPRPGM